MRVYWVTVLSHDPRFGYGIRQLGISLLIPKLEGFSSEDLRLFDLTVIFIFIRPKTTEFYL